MKMIHNLSTIFVVTNLIRLSNVRVTVEKNSSKNLM